MHTELCDELGIEFPIFAFTHCRDVVAAVSKAGGFGVLGAVGFTPEQLEIELDWIDEHVGDKPYGVDIVIPGKYEGMGEIDPEKLADELRAMVPAGHLEFAKEILAEHGVPELPEERERPMRAARLDRGHRHAPGRGRPRPREGAADRQRPGHAARRRSSTEIHASGRLVAALCGSPYQALKHKEAGVDIVIAQGTEGGGHTGDVGSIVLWPQVVDGGRADARCWPPAASAPGEQIAAALALGCARACGPARCGSPSRRPTSRRRRSSSCSTPRAATPCGRGRSPASRAACSRNDWTEAWERPDTPDPLPMPLQYMVSGECVVRGHPLRRQGPGRARSTPCGQVVGQLELRSQDPRRHAAPRRGVHRGRRAPQRPQRLTVHRSTRRDPTEGAAADVGAVATFPSSPASGAPRWRGMVAALVAAATALGVAELVSGLLRAPRPPSSRSANG